MREAKRRDALQLQSKIEEWEASKSEKLNKLVEPAPLGDILGSLKESAADIGQETVEAVLKDCDAAFAIEDRFREKKEAYQQAIKENNYELVSSLALAMKSLEGERDAAYAAIRKTISERTQTRGEGKAESDADAKSEETTEDDDPEAHKSEPERETVSAEDPLVEDHQESTESTAASDRDAGDDGSDRLPDETRKVDEVPIDELADSNNLDEPSVQQPILDDREVLVEQIEAEIATEIKRGRFGLAYHLALAEPKALPSPSVIEFVASNYVTDESAPAVGELSHLADELLGKLEDTLNEKPDLVQRNYATLIASAALSPALVAPHGWIATLLKLMEPRLATLPSLRELVQSVSDASLRGAYLPIELLREDSSLEEWKEKAEALRKEGKAWIAAERRSKIIYAPATRLWYRILEDWENKQCASIGSNVQIARKNQSTRSTLTPSKKLPNTGVNTETARLTGLTDQSEEQHLLLTASLLAPGHVCGKRSAKPSLSPNAGVRSLQHGQIRYKRSTKSGRTNCVPRQKIMVEQLFKRLMD